MNTLRSSTTVPLTRELVTQFATMTPSPTERLLSMKRVDYLHGCYVDGTLGPLHWVSVWHGGTRFRMNGQHSSAMLAKVDPLPDGLTVHLDEYDAEAPADMALLFRRFDGHDSARSVKDVAGAYQGTITELQALDRSTAKLGIDGIAWYLPFIEGIPVGKGDDRYELFRQTVHHDFLHWLNGLISIKTPELKRNEVVAAMYATDLVAGDEARAFWAQVARGGDDYSETHPTTVLDKWLKACKDGTCKDTMKKAFHYQGCLFAWNAYRDGKSIKEIKFDTSKGLHEPHA